MNRKRIFGLQALWVMLIILLGTLASRAQTTVTLEDQCNCEVLKGTEVTAPGNTVPTGAELGDLYVNTDTGALYFWDGDSWETANISAGEWQDGTFNGQNLIYAKQALAANDTIAITDDGRLLVGASQGVYQFENFTQNVRSRVLNNLDYEDADPTTARELFYANQSRTQVANGGTESNDIYFGYEGIVNTLPSNTTNYPTGQLRGVVGQAFHYGSGDMGTAIGGAFSVKNFGSGTINNATGIQLFGIQNLDAGSITNATGIAIPNQLYGTANNVSINIQANQRVAESNYGLKIGNVANATVNNFAIHTGEGDIRLGGIKDSINATHSVVTQDDLGILRKQPIDSLLNGLDTTNDSWFNDPSDSRMELFTLSDGITPRDSTNRIYFTDDGKFVFGSDKPAYIEANGNTNAGFSFVNKEKWNYEDSGPFTGLYGGQLAAINLNNQSALDNQIRFGTRTIIETDSLNTSDYRQIRGLDGAIFHNGSGNILSIQGVDVTSRNNGAGSINNVYGINVGYGHSPKSEGAIGNAIGLNLVVANPIDSIGRTTVNNYGIRIADVKDASNGNWAIHTRAGMVSLGDTLQLRNTVGAALTDVLAADEGIAIIDAEGNVTKRDASVLGALSEWEDVNINGMDAILAKQAAAVGDTLMVMDDSGMFSKTQTMAGLTRDAYNKQLASSGYIPSANDIGEFDFNGFENLVDGASAAANSYYNGILSKVYNDTLSTSPTATSPGMLGIGARVLKYGSADAQNQLIGTQGIVDSKENNTGTIPMAVGARGRVVKRGAGNINNAIGVDAAVNLFDDATGAVTNTRGLFSLINNYDNSLDVVNMDGVLSQLNIRANTKGGSISNANAGNFTLTSPANGAVIENASLLKATIGGNSNASNSNIENFYGLNISSINRGSVSNHAIYTNAGKVSLGDTLQLRNTVGVPLTDILAADEGIAIIDAEGNVTKREAGVLADALSDADFYVAGTTETPMDINDNIYTLGNVGIGTQNPSNPLQVSNDTDGFFAGNNSVISYMGLGSPNTAARGLFKYDRSSGNFSFSNGTAGSEVERMMIRPNGRIGLGTNNPSANLDIFEPTAAAQLELHQGTSNANLVLRTDGAGNSFVSNKNNFVGNGATGNAALILTGQSGISLNYGELGSSGTTGIRLDNLGNVGIGVTLPTSKLDVDGTARLRGLLDDNTATKMVVADANGVLKTQDLGAVVSSAPIRTETANYTVVDGDVSILVDASSNAVTVTLPAPSVGRVVRVKKIDTTTNSMVIDGAGATIDGAATRTTTVAYQSFLVQSDGTNWFIMN